MPVQLLPVSAAAFAPRASSVNVVLGSKVEPWLTQTLKRINRVKRPLNSVCQHQQCLTETLSSPNAIWTLASIILPETPEAKFKRDANNPLAEAIINYELIHIEAYIVHVDMVLRNEVSFKLTKDTTDTLVEYHKGVHCVNSKANTYDWPDKEQQCKKLHEDFVQAINKFVFRTHVSVLEGLEEEGAGELLNGKSEEVKNDIISLMKPILPPSPPRTPTPCVEDVIRRRLLPKPAADTMRSQPDMLGSLSALESWDAMWFSTNPCSAPGAVDGLSSDPAPPQPYPTAAAGFSYATPQVGGHFIDFPSKKVRAL